MNEKLSQYSKSLAHPIRIAILKEIAADAQSCGQIVSKIPLAQSTISQHLKELKDIGLLNCKTVRTSSIYSLNWVEFEKMSENYLVFIKSILIQKPKE